MELLYALMALTTALACSQVSASMTYGSRGVVVGRRDGYDGVPSRRDPFLGSGRRDGSYAGGSLRRDSSYVDVKPSGSYKGGSLNLGRGGSGLGRASGGTYDAGRMVEDLVYNPRRSGSVRSGFDGGRRLGGLGSGRVGELRGCNCHPSEVCERSSRGLPVCRPANGGFMPTNRFPNNNPSCYSDVQLYDRCNVRPGRTAYIFLNGSCRLFTTHNRDPSCMPMGGRNNIFDSRRECMRYCGL